MEQIATTCEVHDGCTVVTCTDGETVLWASHAPDEVPLAERANDDHPDIVDETGTIA